jgi:hypothetical protein
MEAALPSGGTPVSDATRQHRETPRCRRRSLVPRLVRPRTGKLADSAMLPLVVLATLAITMGFTRAAVLAEERSAPQGGVVVAAAVTKSKPQTAHARVAPASCPYDFGSDMPPATFCVYQGVAFGTGGEECAAGVVVIWSSSSPSRGRVEPAENASASNREIYLGFAADPALVLRAIVDAPRSDRAELVGYTVGSEDAPRPLAGMMTLRPGRVGANATVDVLSVELQGPRRFAPMGCAFASYSGMFLGVIHPPSEPNAYVETFIAPSQ